ncbi:MAG: penicillin-binding protein 1A [Acidiferrobacterales bacterium]|nr:penicillin-binding protein 1A [Acidiferrobacterales bacterium]
MKAAIFIHFIRIFCTLAVAAFASIVIAVGLLIPELPDINTIRTLELKIPLRVYSNDGLLMSEYGSERRVPQKIDDAPPEMIAAILAAEDDRYYEHVGIDYRGIVRAAYMNIQADARAQGASTITMQVARNYFLSSERTYIRKAKEALLALKIEQLLTKDEILELYLNKVFLGHRTYGFAAAAMTYYGKALDELDIAQYAMLAALPKAPSRINPIINPEGALTRRDYVLRRMNSLGYISQSEFDTAVASPVTAELHIAEVELKAPYVAETIRQQLLDQFGESVYEDGYSVYSTINSRDQNAAVQALRKGLVDYDRRHGYRGALTNQDLTNLETDVQKLAVLEPMEASQDIVPALITGVADDHVTAFTKSAQQIVIPWEHLKWARRYKTSRSMGAKPKLPGDVVQPGDVVFTRQTKDGAWALSQIPNVEGALISMSTQDGAIKAMVGGFDYYLGKFNRATQAKRQMGSNIKPFVYSAALEYGFTPASLVSGAPVVIEDQSTKVVWRPENYSGKFYGHVPLRKALGLSLNLVSVRLIRGIGPEFAIRHISRFGFDREILPEGLSLALGAAEATPMEVAAGYAVFANGGFQIEPYLIDTIKDRDGNVVMRGKISEVCDTCLFDDSESSEQEYSDMPGLIRPAPRAISTANAFVMHDMLRGVVQTGTARKAKSLNRSDLAGKTGTTNDFEDAWFSGFNPELVTTVWVGFDDPSDLGRHEAGSKAALPIWIDYMAEALVDIPDTELEMPDNVVAVQVDAETGKAVTPEESNGFREVFIVGSEPSPPEVAAISDLEFAGQRSLDNQTSPDDLF